MNLMPGKLTLESCDTINRKRLFASKYKEMYSTKKKKKKTEEIYAAVKQRKDKLIRLELFELL